MNIIELQNVYKQYTVYAKRSNADKKKKSIFHRSSKTVHAVNDVSFFVEEGETVGLIGENGAGKSTLIKMMSGILQPTSGKINICGIVPYKERKKNANNIGVIFGQKSRLLWELPMQDSFELFKVIYKVDDTLFKKNINFFVELLDLKSLTNTPVRQLSLGQRMKAEIALCLLHNPPIFFLDEPTIGLDVLAKKNIRDFIKMKNETSKTTTILTSHDMKDLDSVCSRIIMISEGTLFFDGSITEFKKTHVGKSIVEITVGNETVNTLSLQGLPVSYNSDGPNISIEYNESIISLPTIIDKVFSQNEVLAIKVKEPDIEDIVRNIYLQNTI